MKFNFFSFLAFALSVNLSFQAFAEVESESWVSVTLTSRGCEEIDTDIIGEACVYVAHVKSTGETLFIYDSLPESDSDLGDWTKDHDLRDGQNCFEVQIHQTAELVHRYGMNSFYASKIKRAQCQK